MQHNAELTPEAQNVMKNGKKENDLKKEIISMIEKKYLNLILGLTLDDKNENKPKNKI